MKAPYDSYDYLAYWQGREFEDGCERSALEQIFRFIPFHGSLIDIGGGFGRLCDFYATKFSRCVVLDPSIKLLQQGQKKLKDQKNVFFQEGALPVLPFEDQSFNVALMIRVIHHLVDPLPSFKEINRVLVSDGYLVLEFANKIHFLARLKAWRAGNFAFAKTLSPVEKRSLQSIKEDKITFVNHHPQKIFSYLKKSGFVIKKVLSVSNFRHPLLKKWLPYWLMVRLEKKFQGPLAKFFFGPSIFVLCQKIPDIV